MTKVLPNTFYELIAYLLSACVMVFIIMIGFMSIAEIKELLSWFGRQDTTLKIILLGGVSTISYAYGQMASTISASIVGKPVKFLVKRSSSSSALDYSWSFKDAIEDAGISEGLPEGKRSSKWTIIYYVLAVSPDLGKDYLKRYAREKLARINALNMLILLILSIISLVLNHFGVQGAVPVLAITSPPSYWFLFSVGTLWVLFSYEYFKRKCWNNDLLVKVLPTVKFLADNQRKESIYLEIDAKKIFDVRNME